MSDSNLDHEEELMTSHETNSPNYPPSAAEAGPANSAASVAASLADEATPAPDHGLLLSAAAPDEGRSSAPPPSVGAAPPPRNPEKSPRDAKHIANMASLIRTTDPSSVFFTDSYNESKRLWDVYFMAKMVIGIQQLIDSELVGEENGFFLLFLKYDANLDGTLSVEEISELLHEYGIDQKSQARALAKSVEPEVKDERKILSPFSWTCFPCLPVRAEASEFGS
eukprot:g9132.t1